MRNRLPAALAMLLVGATAMTLAACSAAPGSAPGATAPRVHVAVARTAVDTTGRAATAVADDSTAAGGDVTVQKADLVVPPMADADAASPVPAPTVDPDAAPVVADTLTSDGRVETAPVDTTDVQTVGVTWPHGADAGDLAPQVRTRSDGTWTSWTALDDSDIGPDDNTADAKHMRDGTDSFWIGDADSVQLSFAATPSGGPADMNLTLIGSDPVPVGDAVVGAAARTGAAMIQDASLRTTTDGDGTEGTGVVAPAVGVVSAALTAPAVISRASWGAAPQVCTPDVAGTLVGAVVHHTAGSNSYSTVAEAEAQIRGDQAYHINGRGWCDIGYNFIVDKWGNIYEGRANSLTQPVIGVHAGGFNTGTVGVAMLGEYGAIAPSAAMQEAVSQIIGYRLGAYGRNPAGTISYTTYGGENSRYQVPGTVVTLPTVFGHRDVAFTACPGNLGYAALPAIRLRARAIAYAQPLVRALYHDMLQREPDPTGMATWSAAIMAGTPPGALGTAIAHSREYVQRRVTEAYLEILGRQPDPQGLETQTVEIMAGRLRVEDLRGRLIASDEYFAMSGGTYPAYVSLLYRDILGRGAAPDEVAFWVGQVARSGRGIAPAGIWWSLESAQRRVTEVYATYLDRGPDPTGLATWPPYWIANGEDALRAGIVGSDEYLGRSLKF